MKKSEIIYYHRGLIERGHDYHWMEGYSEQGEHGALYPWSTKRECQKEAKAQGCVARFKEKV